MPFTSTSIIIIENVIMCWVHHSVLCDFEGTDYQCHFVSKISLSDCTNLGKLQQNVSFQKFRQIYSEKTPNRNIFNTQFTCPKAHDFDQVYGSQYELTADLWQRHSRPDYKSLRTYKEMIIFLCLRHKNMIQECVLVIYTSNILQLNGYLISPEYSAVK